MKSMSMDDHGSDEPAWVCRCRNGLPSASSPLIHILAGEKVCIQAMTPMQASSARASRQVRRMASASFSTGLATTRTGTCSEPASRRTTSADCSATCRSVSSPYRSWLPVRNQTSRSC
jgi:hypothetical protein